MKKQARDLRMATDIHLISGDAGLWLSQGDDVGDGEQNIYIEHDQIGLLIQWLGAAQEELQRFKAKRVQQEEPGGK